MSIGTKLPLFQMLLVVSTVFTTMLVGTTHKLTNKLNATQLLVVGKERQIKELGEHHIPILMKRMDALRDQVEIAEMKLQHEQWRMAHDYPEAGFSAMVMKATEKTGKGGGK